MERNINMAMKKEALTNLIADDLAKRNENWTEIDNTFELKADKSDTYTKTEVDTSLGLKANKQQEAWITPTLLNGATGTLQYRKNQFGRVEFRGELFVLNAGDIFIVPVNYRPGVNTILIVPKRAGAGIEYFAITEGGLLYAYTATTTYQTRWNSISYVL